MDFAKAQLEKYGWKEGEGLGKNKDGISVALKPKLKFDNRGLGHDLAKEFTDNWWEQVYNTAASNIDVNSSNGSVNVVTKTKHLDINRKLRTDSHNSFYKTQKQLEFVRNIVHEEANFRTLTDDELFQACSGRTVHKGARHGIKLSGKLSRLEKQEKLLLKKLKNVSLSDEQETLHKKMKKLTKHKEKCHQTDEPDVPRPDETLTLSPNSITSKRKKRRSASLRRVSFCETVTEYHSNEVGVCEPSTDDPNLIVLESRIKDANDNEVANEQNDDNSDEGIEKDLEDTCGKTAGHVSFEEAQVITEKLSKEERRLLKKKRKLEKHKNRATMRFLEQMELDFVAKVESFGKKRKFKNIEDKMVQTEMESPSKGKSHGCKKKKQLKHEERQINSIAKSLGQVCTITDKNQL